MKKWLIASVASIALVACEQNRQVAGPDQPMSAAVTGSDAQIYIVNFDETQTTEAAVTAGILNAGAGAVQFNNFSMVAALATPAQLATISSLPGLEGIYANKQLEYYMLHESVPSIRADAVHVAGITGKGIGVDSRQRHRRPLQSRCRVPAVHDRQRQSALQSGRSVHVREGCAQARA